jgi:NAD(P)-dependent dehydrogenase (short-subunit alcohol dehydrogenase family)
MDLRLDGRPALVTGAGRGVGQAAAIAFARAGALVTVADIRRDSAEQTARQITEDGGNAIAVDLDATEDRSVAAAVDTCRREFGQLAILMTCVGGTAWQPGGVTVGGGGASDLVSVSNDYWDWQLRFNLTSAFLCCRHAIPEMVSGGGGSIVMIGTAGSIDTEMAEGNFHPYVIAKAGLVSMSRLIAGRYGPDGIRSNVIAPFATNSRPSEEATTYASATAPLGRIGTIEEIAAAALFLASDMGAYISGEEIRMDGGAHTWWPPRPSIVAPEVTPDGPLTPLTEVIT